MENEAFSTMTASTKYLKELRTATSFRIYVPIIDLISIAAVFLSIYVIRQLKSKQIFNKSITHLLIASLVYGNAHNLSYTIIETWSLYRSFVYGGNVADMMFTSDECFFQHVINSCVRFLLIAIEIALNIDRLVSILLQKYPYCYPKVCGKILNAAAVILSFSLGWFLHRKGPHPGVETTSCFRETDIAINLCSTNLTSYTILATCCAILDCFMITYTWNDRKNGGYDLQSKYLRVEQHYSLLAVSLNSLLQLFVTSTYTISMYVLATMSQKNPEWGNANLIRWFYTTPYATLLVPIQITAYIRWISYCRKRTIIHFTRESVTQETYFRKLHKSWM